MEMRSVCLLSCLMYVVTLVSGHKTVVVEHRELQNVEEEDLLSKYDTFNIASCLAIAQVKDDTNANNIASIEVIGISSCLAQAAADAITAKGKVVAEKKSDDLDTAANVWPINGPGYGFPGITGGWYPRVWTDPQFNYGANYDYATRDANLHPYRIDNSAFPNVDRTLRQLRKSI